MLNKVWSNLGAKQLNLRGGGGGGKGMEYLLASALVIVILGAVGMLIRSALGGGENGAPDGVHYVCKQCKNDMVKKFDQVQVNLDPKTNLPLGLDCPKCGAKNSCFQAMKCPKCGKYYIMASQMANPMRPGPMMDLQNICPYCNTNFLQYTREHSRQ